MIVGRFGVGNIQFRNPYVDPPSREAPISESTRLLLELDANRILERIGRAVDRLERVNPTRSLSVAAASPASAISSAPIGLTTVPTRAALSSSVEINETATSFSPTEPAWTLLSTSSLELTGFYDGNQGTDTLDFVATAGGVLGLQEIQVEVRDGEGSTIETIVIPVGATQDDSYEIDNGLVLTIGDGLIQTGDSFAVDVADNDPQSVDPDAAFDGSDGRSINFGSDSMVTAGSFRLNGTTISIVADDTINTVLAKITAESDVIATFDHESDSVALSHTLAGSGHDIVLDNDTSGFVAAVKLDDAILEPGEDSETADDLIATLDPLVDSASGTLGVNDSPVAVDPDADSLNGLLDRIATIDQIDARYSGSTDRVRIASTSGSLRLVDETTGILAGLNIEARTYEGRAGRRGLTRRESGRVVDEIGHLVKEVNDLDRLLSGNPTVRPDVRAALRSALAGFDEDGVLGQLGIEQDSSGEALRFRSASSLTRSLRQDPTKAFEAMFGTDRADGLLGFLEQLS